MRIRVLRSLFELGVPNKLLKLCSSVMWQTRSGVRQKDGLSPLKAKQDQANWMSAVAHQRTIRYVSICELALPVQLHGGTIANSVAVL